MVDIDFGKYPLYNEPVEGTVEARCPRTGTRRVKVTLQ